jgi:hypothetical protein
MRADENLGFVIDFDAGVATGSLGQRSGQVYSSQPSSSTE